MRLHETTHKGMMSGEQGPGMCMQELRHAERSRGAGTCDDDGLAEARQEQRQRSRGVCQGVRAVDDDEGIIVGPRAVQDARQVDPEQSGMKGT